MPTLDPRSKRALIALALIAGGWIVGEAIAVGGPPLRTWVGGILMYAGLASGISLLVFSILRGRRQQ